ncbi:hypothetical protein CW748_07530 [Alteromonadales bacterium alter-6D02]|nr:hypothetical protein CW748_07530 [Alteromonadales bacterium alter-6D02]
MLLACGGGEGESQPTSVVDNKNTAPVITSIAPTSATEGVFYQYTANVTDSDDSNNGTDLTWQLINTPAGMNVSSTGVVTWTPANGVLSSGQVTLQVRDGQEDRVQPATEQFTISVTPVNTAPVITSIAPTSAAEGVFYQYTANVTDSDDSNNGTDLTWQLINAPAGMNVSSTGVVTWTPANGVLSSGQVTLQVRDGQEDGVQPATEQFTISVISVNTPPVITIPTNTAPVITSTAPTKATEGVTYQYTAQVTDSDDSNNGTDLTWQLINAPAGMNVSSTGVVTWTPANGVLSSGQVTLHVRDGQEGGVQPATEQFTITVTPVNTAPVITSTAPIKATEGELYQYTATVTDSDDSNNGTDLTWQLINAPDGMNVSPSGLITWTPANGVLTTGVITLQVADGGEDEVTPATQQFTITVTPTLVLAMQTGNVAHLPQDITFAYDEVIRLADTFVTDYKANLNSIFDGAITYPVHRASQFVTAKPWAANYNAPLVVGNGGRVHAMFGEINQQRNAAFGTRIFASSRPSQELEAFSPALIQLISWLTKSAANEPLTELDIKVANVSAWQFNQINAWFDTLSSAVTVSHCVTELDIEHCVNDDTDLLIIAAENDSSALINTALPTASTLRVPVLYTHAHSWNTKTWTNAILDSIGYSMQSPGGPGNYFVSDEDRHANWLDFNAMFEQQVSQKSLPLIAKNLVSRFKENSFSYNLPACNESDCSNDPNYKTQLTTGLEVIRHQFIDLDSNNTQIFGADGFEVLKLLALIGDRFRQNIALPMDKATANVLAWSQGIFADFTVYNSRLVNPVQVDLGDFSRTNFNHITPKTVNMTMQSKPYMRAAGVYALPGTTVKVTRTDTNNALSTSIFINAQRSGSSKPFTNRLFERPKYLKSASMTIAAGESITFTSPYGGPLYINYDDVGVEASFTFEQVGQHPYWNGPEDSDFFAKALDDNHYDWVDIAAEHMEIHSRLEKVKTTLSSPISPDVETLAAMMQTYTHGDVMALAGFTGPGIQVTDEVTNFANSSGIPLTPRDRVQHGVLDQSTCGSGCSGNPYDANWSFSPLGHGDLHEIGHTIENGWFRFDGREGHATTNPYSYYTKHRAWVEQGIEPNCQNVKFDEIHASLVTAQSEPDPHAYMASLNMNDWNKGVALMIQVLMSAQHQGVLVDGWQLYPMLHILKRELDRIDGNDTDWEAGKAKLGFSQYARSELSSLSRNDFLLVSMSFILKYNLQSYLEMFGLSFSAKAISQVQAGGYPVMPRDYFLPAVNQDFCKSLTQPKISF